MLTSGRILLGAFDDVETAVAFVERVALTPAEVARVRWPVARAAFLAAPPVIAAPVMAIDPTQRAMIEDVLSAPLFAGSLAAKRWQLMMLPLDSLVIAQPMLNLARIDALRSRVEANPLEAFFPVTTTLDVATRTGAGPTITLLSSRGELTVSGAQLRREPDNGAIEILLRVEPRPNYVSALHDGGVYVLRNGHHRIAAAWRNGLAAVPCVIVEGSMEALAARMRNGLPPSALRRARPPVLSDLADEGPMSIEVVLRPKEYALNIFAQQEVLFADPSQQEIGSGD